MKRWIWRVLALTAALLLGVAMLTACGDGNDVVIYDTNPTEAEEESEPTQPIPEGRLSLSTLMALMGPHMVWSDISEYEYTAVSDTEAAFTVQNNNGQTCTLTVTYDAATDVISTATLSCGDVKLDAMSGETAVVRKILVAMNEQQGTQE